MALPSSKAADVVLTQPTHEEILEQRAQNAAEWKGALTLDAYFRREEYLMQQSLTGNGGLTPWALVHGTGSGRVVLSSCETIRKRALVGRDGEVRDVICHGVASVFCAPEYRGKGYASRMIKDLGETLKTWHVEDGEEVMFSVLWSDIGKDFYAKHQWLPFPSAHVSLSPSMELPSGVSLPPTRPLHTKDVADLCKIDQRIIRNHVSKASEYGKTAVAIVPDAETMLWHLGREDFISNELYGKVPEVKGAIVGDKPGERAWVWWMRIFANPNPAECEKNKLEIIRLVVEDEDYNDFSAASEEGTRAARESRVAAATAALLAAAQAEASKSRMEKVNIWNPTSATLAAVRLLSPSVQVEHREEESISSLRWYGASAAEAETAARKVEWIGNEKYGWC